MSWYLEQLKHPEWQKKRLLIFQRDNFTCRFCGEKEMQLHVHHIIYLQGYAPWEYKDEHLITLCEECHQDEEKLKTEDQFLIAMFVQTGLSRRQLYSLATELRRHVSEINVRHYKFTDLMDYLHG